MEYIYLFLTVAVVCLFVLIYLLKKEIKKERVKLTKFTIKELKNTEEFYDLKKKAETLEKLTGLLINHLGIRVNSIYLQSYLNKSNRFALPFLRDTEDKILENTSFNLNTKVELLIKHLGIHFDENGKISKNNPSELVPDKYFAQLKTNVTKKRGKK